MASSKCPFSAIQAAGSARCTLAQQVVRRGGSEYDCTNAEALAVCEPLSRHLIEVGLAALGYQDDLTTTPKSAYDRALLGGLSGIGGVLGDTDKDAALADIWTLVGRLVRHYPDLAALPDAELVGAMRAYKAPRRRDRQRD